MAVVQDSVCNIHPIDLGLGFPYKIDRLARELKRLATSTVGSKLYVCKCGNIVHAGRVYIPFTEAERIFRRIYYEDSHRSYGHMLLCFRSRVYSPTVTEKLLRRWFEDCRCLGLEDELAKTEAKIVSPSYKVEEVDDNDYFTGTESSFVAPRTCTSTVRDENAYEI